MSNATGIMVTSHYVLREVSKMSRPAEDPRGVLIRDFLIFQLKLALDGLKGLLVLQLSVAALIADLLLARRLRSRFFYGLLGLAERADLWLNLYGSTPGVSETRDGLFGTSQAGSDSLLGKLEELARGRDYDRRSTGQPRTASTGARVAA